MLTSLFRLFESLQGEVEAEQKLKVEHLQQASNNQSTIEQLHRLISDKENEEKLIRQRLNDLELELKKSIDENTQRIQEKEASLHEYSSQLDQQ